MNLNRFHFLFSVGMAVLFSANAEAAISLKRVQVLSPTQVDLLFDDKISANQVKTEFNGDIIQLSLENVSVYPAKVHSMSGKDLQKIFAYQYSPSLVRCRFTVNGKAADYQNRIQIKHNGKVLSLKIDPKSDAVVKTEAPKKEQAEIVLTNSEKNLIEKLENQGNVAPVTEKSVEKAEKKSLSTADQNSIQIRQSAAVSSPNILKTILMTLLVMVCFVCSAIVMKKFRLLKFGKKGSADSEEDVSLQVVSSHALGPKKSLMVVKIQNRTLLLGVSEDSMSLITELNGDSKSAAKQADADGRSSSVKDFAQTLKAFEDQPVAKGQDSQRVSNAAQQAVKAYQGKITAELSGNSAFDQYLQTESKKTAFNSEIRSKIKNRIEGMKRL